MEQIRPAQSIIACGPMQDTKRFFSARHVSKVHGRGDGGA